MDYRNLGRSHIRVSTICLGSMTWGEQNSEAEGHRQLDSALAAGVNFIDTAEMYPIAPRQETYGETERVIGSWLAARGQRDKVVIASKILGPSSAFSYVRNGDLRHTRANIHAALDASLKRLRTDYIDLYQLHWPERPLALFGPRGYDCDWRAPFTPLEEVLDALDEAVRAGKVRTIGLSNEAPWGVMRYLALSETLGLARIVSVQNAYSLVNRQYESTLAEIGLREDVGLLAYSPLASGKLSGKYLNGARPEGARITIWPKRYGRYASANTERAIADYVMVAQRHGLDPAQMAIAYVLSKPFLTSAIIGATTEQQLATNLAAATLSLSAEVRAEIEAIHNANPDPAP